MSTSRLSGPALQTPSTSSSSAIHLKQNVIQSFLPSKTFGPPMFKKTNTVTSLSFDDRGEYLVSAGDDETIHIWSCAKGKHAKTLYSKKYGVDLARFTHRNDAIIYASTKEDDTIRHHSLHDNKYLQYFRGHSSKVTSLQMSPVDELFLSAAISESVRLWDLRSPNCQGLLPLQGHPVVAWDTTGLVFYLALREKAIILLYDVKSFSTAPLLEISLLDLPSVARNTIITSLSVNPSGSMVLIGTASDSLFIADSTHGSITYILKDHDCFKIMDSGSKTSTADSQACGQECGWTPDGQYIFAGSHSRGIQFWRIPDYQKHPNTQSPMSLVPTTALDSTLASQPRAVAFDPRFAMIASASTHVTFWLPELESKEG